MLFFFLRVLNEIKACQGIVLLSLFGGGGREFLRVSRPFRNGQTLYGRIIYAEQRSESGARATVKPPYQLASGINQKEQLTINIIPDKSATKTAFSLSVGFVGDAGIMGTRAAISGSVQRSLHGRNHISFSFILNDLVNNL